MKKPEAVGLCWRCEWRAVAHETGGTMRYECGMLDRAVHGCYMYEPVKPLALLPQEGERRSLRLPSMLSGRANGYKVGGLKLVGETVRVGRRKGLLKLWVEE